MSPQYPELAQSQIEQIFSKKIQAHIDTLTVGSKAATLVMVGAQLAAEVEQLAFPRSGGGNSSAADHSKSA